jgi:hypothetical protein
MGGEIPNQENAKQYGRQKDQKISAMQFPRSRSRLIPAARRCFEKLYMQASRELSYAHFTAMLDFAWIYSSRNVGSEKDAIAKKGTNLIIHDFRLVFNCGKALNPGTSAAGLCHRRGPHDRLLMRKANS